MILAFTFMHAHIHTCGTSDSPTVNAGEARDVVRSRAWENLPQEETATHFTILAWRILCAEEG